MDAELMRLEVTSHVGRDILASASIFRDEAAVVWEYVINSIQYVDDGVTPNVHVAVHVRNKRIEIRDNGCGMDVERLQHFFTMHGENIERKRGRPGRGKFGTGKSAAFGIAKTLTVDTVRGGKRNRVHLTREAIERSDGKRVPLNWEIQQEDTVEKNGTTVIIDDVVLPKISIEPVIEYIERNLQVFRQSLPQVAVNNHVCAVNELAVAEMHRFQPEGELRSVLGGIQLIVKVSPVPLAPQDIGIAITAGAGNYVAQESSGIDRKELGNYLFGEVDVPMLESGEYEIEPYDASRSLKLNRMHPVAGRLIGFIGAKLEEVRKDQARKLRAAKESEEAKKLEKEANKIANILNEDFAELVGKLQDIKSAATRSGNVASSFGKGLDGGSEADQFVRGFGERGELDRPIMKSTPEENPPPVGEPRPDPNIPQSGHKDSSGEQSVTPRGGNETAKSRPRGGFSVDYRYLGKDKDRSSFDKNTLTILINLDHPLISTALKEGGIEDNYFKRFSFEIAFSEYSFALGNELALRDPDMPADDLLFEVRRTLNRVSTRVERSISSGD